MKKIKQNCVITSAAYVVPRSKIQYFEMINKLPAAGDLVYGEVKQVGAHKTLESRAARIHTISGNIRAIFVFGNRYSPDHFEGVVPDLFDKNVDLLARGGVVGKMICKNDAISDPTKIEILGYVCDKNGEVVNSNNFCIINPRKTSKNNKRAKMILCIGTSMNSGKSTTAAACCYALSSMGKDVRAAKVTGTASLKDILLMQDCGASHIADFTYIGHPSTYLLDEKRLLDIFDRLDLRYANNSNNYWVVEIADGILQRETAILLRKESVRSRIHRLIFCARDALGAISGLNLLKERFGIDAHVISGVCASSPLALRELSEFSKLPILNNLKLNFKDIFPLIK